ncbi:MAG: hypothetical protein HWN66_09390 [Candidatus Helarchaeota archaeon]|nr:hypothetical protein [Candidatus Helarchaeota archaeon]
MSIQDMSQYDPESYYKMNTKGFDIFFQTDAYFMVSGLSKLTIMLSNTSYGDFLAIKEFEPSLN